MAFRVTPVAQPPSLVANPPTVDAPDLIDALPPFERQSYDIQGALTAIGNELARVEQARQEVIANFFPATADGLLGFFEQMLGLPVAPAGTTLAQRQNDVLAYMLGLKADASGLSWEASVTAVVGTNWTYKEHDPADPSSPAAYTVLVDIPFSTPASQPANLAVTTEPASGTLPSGTYAYAMSTLTTYGETLPGTPVDVDLTATGANRLTWTPQSAPTTGFNIYRGPNDSSLELLTTISSAASGSFVDDGSYTPIGTAPPTTDTSASDRANVVQQLLRRVTPAHLTIEVGYQQGFIVGYSDVGEEPL